MTKGEKNVRTNVSCLFCLVLDVWLWMFVKTMLECYQRIESVMNDEWLLLIIDLLLIKIFQGVSLNCKGNFAQFFIFFHYAYV